MSPDIQILFDAKQPLPQGTRIRTTIGGAATSETHELSEHVLASANIVPNHLSDDEPFWIHGWRDLHDKLSLPTLSVRDVSVGDYYYSRPSWNSRGVPVQVKQEADGLRVWFDARSTPTLMSHIPDDATFTPIEVSNDR